MNAACVRFRARLANALSAPAGSLGGELSWHEHLLSCGDCRALLEAEEALEILLESLPSPALPPALAHRVLQRLQPVRAERELDVLLDTLSGGALEGELAPPLDLAGSVLARLRDARHHHQLEQRLDRLLELVPAPREPVGLAGRVLAALEPERAQPTRGLRPLLLAASLAALLGGAVWAWAAFRSQAPGAPNDRVGPIVDSGPRDPAPIETAPIETAPIETAPREGVFPEPSAELLAQLDLLESWDVLLDDSLDFTLAGIDENTLLGLQTSATLDEDGASTDQGDDTGADKTRKG